jgi:CheY-like chemotaxis protein
MTRGLVLLVEDDDGDALLVEEAMRPHGDRVRLERCVDGDAALARLRAVVDAGAAVPDLVLLDLNLPGTQGLEVLRHIKTHPVLRTIPVTVLSTSDDPATIRTAYESAANAYVSKPVLLDDFLERVGRLGTFWLDDAQRPTSPRG